MKGSGAITHRDLRGSAHSDGPKAGTRGIVVRRAFLERCRRGQEAWRARRSGESESPRCRANGHTARRAAHPLRRVHSQALPRPISPRFRQGPGEKHGEGQQPARSQALQLRRSNLREPLARLFRPDSPRHFRQLRDRRRGNHDRAVDLAEQIKIR